MWDLNFKSFDQCSSWIISEEDTLDKITLHVDFYEKYIEVFTPKLQEVLHEYLEGREMIEWMQNNIGGVKCELFFS